MKWDSHCQKKWYALIMSFLMLILTPLVFIGAVVGLTRILSTSTKKDADRWLVDRRLLDRRQHDVGTSDNIPERRKKQRRHPDGSSTRL